MSKVIPGDGLTLTRRATSVLESHALGSLGGTITGVASEYVVNEEVAEALFNGTHGLCRDRDAMRRLPGLDTFVPLAVLPSKISATVTRQS